MCSNLEVEKQDLISVVTIPKDELHSARASIGPDSETKTIEDVPPKKRKTRRGKRRHPYLKNRLENRKSASGENEQVRKPEAPHNSNQFLIEDHGNPQEIDERLRNENNVGRTRDSSFSVDSDAEFYSSPDDEEALMQKDFDDTYENFKVERLNMLSKSELIEEFLQQEKRNELKRRTRSAIDAEILLYKKELTRVNNENEFLTKENKHLRVQLYGCSGSGSADSESDSSTSCTTCTSENSDQEEIDYRQTNGHSPSTLHDT